MVRFTDIWLACRAIHSQCVEANRSTGLDSLIDVLKANIPLPGVPLLAGVLQAVVKLYPEREKEVQVNNMAAFCDGNLMLGKAVIENFAVRLTLKKQTEIRNLAKVNVKSSRAIGKFEGIQSKTGYG